MAKRKETEYIFASSFVGNFVGKLMSEKDIMRVATARDLDAAESILKEFGYEESKELKENDIDAFMRRQQEILVSQVYGNLPDEHELDFNLYPYDYHNAKVCLKFELMGKPIDESFLAPIGSIKADKLVTMIRERDYAFMPAHMKHAVIDAVDTYGRSKDPQVIDVILDKACYAQMLENVKESKTEYLENVVKTKIDALNLSTFMRLKHLSKPWAVFKGVFVDGGNIDLQFFINNYEETYSRIAEHLEPYGFTEAVAEGGKELNDKKSFSLFEKQRDNYVMDQISKAKYMSFGIEPIEGYWCAKERELDNLKIALTGNLYGFKPEETEERLRKTYV